MGTDDGTPCAVKVACTVWSGGKGGDDFKVLPITMCDSFRLLIAGGTNHTMIRRTDRLIDGMTE